MLRPDVDDDVVSSAQRGDAGALSTIYLAYAPLVQGYLRAKGLSDPDGTTSDVFLAVLPRIPALTGGASGLRTLLFSVAHARIVDEHRARARRPPPVSYEPEVDERVTSSAEAEAELSLGTERVKELLSILPADQRDVLALRIVADLSVEQVASIIRRSTGAVKQLQRRGLLTIRRVLAEHRVSQVGRASR